jgi:hypothetical protein
MVLLQSLGSVPVAPGANMLWELHALWHILSPSSQRRLSIHRQTRIMKRRFPTVTNNPVAYLTLGHLQAICRPMIEALSQATIVQASRKNSPTPST